MQALILLLRSHQKSIFLSLSDAILCTLSIITKFYHFCIKVSFNDDSCLSKNVIKYDVIFVLFPGYVILYPSALGQGQMSRSYCFYFQGSVLHNMLQIGKMGNQKFVNSCKNVIKYFQSESKIENDLYLLGVNCTEIQLFSD